MRFTVDVLPVAKRKLKVNIIKFPDRHVCYEMMMSKVVEISVTRTANKGQNLNFGK